MRESIGLIETMGIIAAIEASDVMLKTSNVTLLNKEIVKGGLVTVMITGDVSAVKTAVDSAVVAVNRLGNGLLVSSHVIARPDKVIECLFSKGKEMPVIEQQEVEEALVESVLEVTVIRDESDAVVDVELKKELSQEEIIDLLNANEKESVRNYLLDKTVAQLREMAKQHNDFVIERKELYRTNKSELVEGIINYFSNKS